MDFSSRAPQIGVARRSDLYSQENMQLGDSRHVESYRSAREELFPNSGHHRLPSIRFAITDPRKVAVPTRTTRGPGGSPVPPARPFPATTLPPPNASLSIPYRERLLLTFVAAAAG